jgi:hypothetical protein
MSTNKIKANTKVLFFIGFVVIAVAFLQFGGQPWIKGLMEGIRTIGMAHWNWIHMLIMLGLGFLLGLLVSMWTRRPTADINL